MKYRNAPKPHVRLRDTNGIIPQVQEIPSIQHNQGNILRIQLSNQIDEENNNLEINDAGNSINIE